ncbi:MAG TPA: hypothetical protein VGB55_04020, partial [Tepidisphaeraceae bacterium]
MHTDRPALSRLNKFCPTQTAARRFAVLGMAVALAMPATGVPQALAQDRPVLLVALQNADPKAALVAAVDQFKAGKYEEALTALQAIDAGGLSEGDRKIHADTVAQAEQAAQARRGARADFEKAEAALAAGNNVEALNLYKSVSSNTYADEGTKAKANEQIAVAQAGVKEATTDWKAEYDSAVADYKAGNFDASREKFTRLQEAGYKAAWFDKSPRDYLAEIDKQAAKGDQASARSAYLTGRDQYNKGDWIAARQNFNKAVEGGYKAGLFETPPAKYLATMDKKELADATKAARQDVAMGNVAQSADVAEGVGAPAGPAVEGAIAAQNDEAVLRDVARAQGVEADQKRFRAAKLIESAEAAEKNNRATEAANLYSEALELDPNNATATAGRNRLLNQGGLSAVQEPLDVRITNEINARRQAIQFGFDQALATSQIRITEGQFGQARTAINEAEAASVSDRGIFNNTEIQAFEQRLARARTDLAQAEERARSSAAANAVREAEISAGQREQERVAAQEQATASLIADARRLTEQGRYSEALKVVNQILSIDPRNSYAAGVQQILFDRASLQEQRTLRENFSRQVTNSFTQVNEKRIPYSDVLTYPQDWPDLAARREETVRDERNVTPADEAVTSLLEKSLPEIRF